MEKNQEKIVISADVAEKEVLKWLDYKKYSTSKREDQKDSISIMENAICDGDLVLNKDNVFIQKLKFPIKDEDGKEVLSELKFVPRIPVIDIEKKSKGMEANNYSVVRAYICALTKINSGLVGRLDTEDHRVSQAIVSFFL